MKKFENYVKLSEGRKYSPEFKKALNDTRNTQAGTAETLGRNTAMNPEVIYDWANKHGINLTLEAYKYFKDLTKFARAVMADKPI